MHPHAKENFTLLTESRSRKETHEIKPPCVTFETIKTGY